ncbi:hypothetical protein AJ78_08629 [Emergomyces pasteurianus Ep9510]|uniref:Uncharacterized protein n=1 Tax=Emergomyces pasteurianus Ep9510 TaxID=1447872 RepID=A0A1J9P1U4_9EURO|nr:hypothetical protein AJ78_08629 [Emergomyces pasteurianus Ep9510]
MLYSLASVALLYLLLAVKRADALAINAAPAASPTTSTTGTITTTTSTTGAITTTTSTSTITTTTTTSTPTPTPQQYLIKVLRNSTTPSYLAVGIEFESLDAVLTNNMADAIPVMFTPDTKLEFLYKSTPPLYLAFEILTQTHRCSTLVLYGGVTGITKDEAGIVTWNYVDPMFGRGGWSNQRGHLYYSFLQQLPHLCEYVTLQAIPRSQASARLS